MNTDYSNGNKGFLKLIISIVIALIILSYFGFDLREIMEAPQTQENLRYFWGLIQNIWFTYIWRGMQIIWQTIFVELLWNNLQLIWRSGSENF